jgi:Ca2+-binding RTX toxin-like protein
MKIGSLQLVRTALYGTTYYPALAVTTLRMAAVVKSRNMIAHKIIGIFSLLCLTSGAGELAFADILDNSGTSARITVPESFYSDFYGTGDADWIRVRLTAGTRYKFGAYNEFGDNITLTLFNKNGRLISGPRTDSFGTAVLDHISTYSGDHFISASTSSSVYSEYDLSVQIDAEAGDRTTSAKMTVGAAHRGNLRNPSGRQCGVDVDWIGVALEANKTYSFMLNETDDFLFSIDVYNISGTPPPIPSNRVGEYSIGADSGIYKCVRTTSAGTHFMQIKYIAACGLDYIAKVVLGCPFGTEIADAVNGTDNADSLFGYGGDDIINGLGGDDFIEGGPGSDTIDGGVANDTVSWYDDAGSFGVVVTLPNPNRGLPIGSAIRHLDAGGTVYDLDQLSRIENAQGTLFDDVMTGNEIENSLVGFGGADRLYGLGGNDLFKGGTGDDILDGGDGLDIASYSDRGTAVTVNLNLVPAQITLIVPGTGSAERDQLFAIEGVEGTRYSDIFTGSGGPDLFRGLVGKDRQTGGGGVDTFDFDALGDSPVGTNRDVITDFVPGQDKVDVSTIDANVATAGDQAFAFLAARGAAFTGPGQLRWRQEGSVTLIEGNVNADRAADFQIELSGIKSLTARDVIR